LNGFAAGRIDDDKVGRFAARYQDFTVRAQRKGLRTHAGQCDLASGGSQQLARGSDVTISRNTAYL
jgi:hypothetical protein